MSLTKAIGSSNAMTAHTLLAVGIHPNVCNKCGESTIHAACCRGNYAMLRTLVDTGPSDQVGNNFGRISLPDAC